MFFLETMQTDKISGQSITICCMVGSAFAMCGLILAYHCYVVCQRIEAIKRLILRVVSSLKGPQNRALTNDDRFEATVTRGELSLTHRYCTPLTT